MLNFCGTNGRQNFFKKFVYIELFSWYSYFHSVYRKRATLITYLEANTMTMENEQNELSFTAAEVISCVANKQVVFLAPHTTPVPTHQIRAAFKFLVLLSMMCPSNKTAADLYSRLPGTHPFIIPPYLLARVLNCFRDPNKAWEGVQILYSKACPTPIDVSFEDARKLFTDTATEITNEIFRPAFIAD